MPAGIAWSAVPSTGVKRALANTTGSKGQFTVETWNFQYEISNHILLDCLQSEFALSLTLNSSYVSTFLINHHKAVHLAVVNVQCAVISVETSMPQGSVLGPLRASVLSVGVVITSHEVPTALNVNVRLQPQCWSNKTGKVPHCCQRLISPQQFVPECCQAQIDPTGYCQITVISTWYQICDLIWHTLWCITGDEIPGHCF